MKPTLKKAFLVVLPLAGLLFTAPAAFAHDHDHHHHHGWSAYDRPSYGGGWSEPRRYSDSDRDDYNRHWAPGSGRGWSEHRRYSDGDRDDYNRHWAPWSGRGWYDRD